MNDIVSKLRNFIEQENFAGYDPYDGLNSAFLRFFTFGRKWPRLAVQQFMKRSRMNLRPVFGIGKARNPKGIGLSSRAYLELYRQDPAKNEDCLIKTRELLKWLQDNSAKNFGYSGYCWGYNFDWQSAVFFIPKSHPTAVNTAFNGFAFLDAFEVTAEEEYLDVARSACDFILKDLHKTGKGTTFCFSYSPFDHTCTHNANLLAAELLIRVHWHTKEATLMSHAGRAVDFTLSHFNADGSIYQGTLPAQKFIDSFHTGFVLTSLQNIAQMSKLDENHPEYMRIMHNAYKYYKLTFFDPDGMPHYYYHKIYPVDLHCSSQGIITFLKFQDYDHEALATARAIADWTIENMWDSDKNYFYFQKTKHYMNKIAYLRWPNIWMLYALALLQHAGWSRAPDIGNQLVI